MPTRSFWHDELRTELGLESKWADAHSRPSSALTHMKSGNKCEDHPLSPKSRQLCISRNDILEIEDSNTLFLRHSFSHTFNLILITTL